MIEEALALAQLIVENAPLSVRWSKRVMLDALGSPEEEAWEANLEARGWSCRRPTPWRDPWPSPRNVGRSGRVGDAVNPSTTGALTPALDGVRASLHVLAAAVWVGGQITMAGLVPSNT